MSEFQNKIDTINDFLGRSHQMWLLGAGASAESNIPLIGEITKKVKSALNSAVITAIADDLGDDQAHIENILTYLGDLIALAERSKAKHTRLPNGDLATFDELTEVHRKIIREIYRLVTRGIDPDTQKIATVDHPVISLAHHIGFIRALQETIKSESNRQDLSFVTTNYDTLIEDALNVEGIPTKDGFIGGSVGVWNPGMVFGQKVPIGAIDVLKLHGSAEWVRHDNKVVRRRTNIEDFKGDQETLIFPQATKYKLTQQDPFQQLFNEFRSKLKTLADKKGTLFTCGYSWGDQHINHEIFEVMQGSQLHIVAFNKKFPEALQKWGTKSSVSEDIGTRMFIAHESGISHINGDSIDAPPPSLTWWKFSGLTDFIKTGNPVAGESSNV